MDEEGGEVHEKKQVQSFVDLLDSCGECDRGRKGGRERELAEVITKDDGKDANNTHGQCLAKNFY